MAAVMQLFKTDDKKVVEAIWKAKLPSVVKYIGDKKFMCGDTVTFVDFFFFELIGKLRVFFPEIVYASPILTNYLIRVGSLPKIKEYLENPNSRDNTMPIIPPAFAKMKGNLVLAWVPPAPVLERTYIMIKPDGI